MPKTRSHRTRSNGGMSRSTPRTSPKRRSSPKRATGLRSKLGNMDLEKAMVLLHTALAIAIVIKQSRNKNRSGKSEPIRSAMSVLSHYLNEGRELTASQRATLEDVKEELRALYARRATAHARG